MNKENIASHYKGDKGQQYALGRQQDNLSHFGYHLQAKFYLPHLNKDMRVLDFGCGNGSMAKVIEPHVKLIEGLEINDYPRQLASEKQGLNVYGAIDEIAKDTKFDAIISNHVFEHVPAVIDILGAISSLLVPGGRLITVLPIDDFRARENQNWQGEDINHHLQTWTPRLFANSLREAGFSPQEVRVVTSAWTPKAFFLGDGIIQSAFCRAFAILKRRRQLLAVAITR